MPTLCVFCAHNMHRTLLHSHLFDVRMDAAKCGIRDTAYDLRVVNNYYTSFMRRRPSLSAVSSQKIRRRNVSKMPHGNEATTVKRYVMVHAHCSPHTSVQRAPPPNLIMVQHLGPELITASQPPSQERVFVTANTRNVLPAIETEKHVPTTPLINQMVCLGPVGCRALPFVLQGTSHGGRRWQ